MENCPKINHWWVPPFELEGKEWAQEMSLSGVRGYNPQFLSSGGRKAVKFVVQIRDFVGLRWEQCLFHSVLLHPSAATSSSSKRQKKMHFHLIFFFTFWKMGHQTGRSGTAFGEIKLFPTSFSSLWLAGITAGEMWHLLTAASGSVSADTYPYSSQLILLCIHVLCLGWETGRENSPQILPCSNLVSQSWASPSGPGCCPHSGQHWHLKFI